MVEQAAGECESRVSDLWPTSVATVGNQPDRVGERVGVVGDEPTTSKRTLASIRQPRPRNPDELVVLGPRLAHVVAHRAARESVMRSPTDPSWTYASSADGIVGEAIKCGSALGVATGCELRDSGGNEARLAGRKAVAGVLATADPRSHWSWCSFHDRSYTERFTVSPSIACVQEVVLRPGAAIVGEPLWWPW